MSRIRIRLRVGITAVFLLIVVPLSAAMILFIYSRNADLARDMARQAMDMTAREVTLEVGGVISGMSRALDMAVAYGQGRQEELRNPDTLRPMLEQLEQMPGVFSLYYAMHEDGAFFQVVRPSPDTPFTSPSGKALPEGAKWVVRVVDDSSGRRRDTILYLAKWGKVVGLERGPAAYQPQDRPWYQAALAKNGIAGSDVYKFAGAQQAGLTLSRRLTTGDGARLAVFGIDMTLSSLASFLRNRKVGESGKVFILDGAGRLIGHPDITSIMTGSQQPPDGAQAPDLVIAQAVQERRAGKGDRVSVQPPGYATPWLVGFTPFNNRFDQAWTIGVAVSEDDFIGPIKQASLVILAAGALFLVVAASAIMWAARLLVRPIEDLIVETDRIRRLELENPVGVKSPVLEIDALAGAFASLKTGLLSFGTYVPKSLVETIVQSGIGMSVGGQKRPLTVLFTDLEGFTSAAESMPPEQVLPWLSEYFDAMSAAIHSNCGVIDKYIGDAVMAIWNAPLDDADHAANACRAMLACKRAARGMSSGAMRLKTRMGLHTGQAVVGNVGASDRMQYTALGAMVNLAARVESLNKQLGTELLITGDVARAIGPDFLLRPMGRVLPVGTSQPVDICELLDADDYDSEALNEWITAMDAINCRDWNTAARSISLFLQRRPDDKAAALYDENLISAQNAGWDGVLRFDRK